MPRSHLGHRFWFSSSSRTSPSGLGSTGVPFTSCHVWCPAIRDTRGLLWASLPHILSTNRQNWSNLLRQNSAAAWSLYLEDTVTAGFTGSTHLHIHSIKGEGCVFQCENLLCLFKACTLTSQRMMKHSFLMIHKSLIYFNHFSNRILKMWSQKKMCLGLGKCPSLKKKECDKQLAASLIFFFLNI